jgi:parvulin-like peptidyl-prolyl isomerase
MAFGYRFFSPASRLRLRGALPLSLFALCLLVASPPPAAAIVLDRIAAVVNDEIILDSEVNQNALQTARAELGDVDFATPEGQRKFEQHRKKTLESLVERVLIMQQAREMKVEITEDELRSAVDSVRTQNNLSPEQFQEALKQQGFNSIEEYKKSLQKQLVQLRVINQAVRSKITVGDDEVRALYAQNVRQASGDAMQVHLKQIFLAVPTGANATQLDEKRRLGMKIIAELRGGKDFTALAKQHGDDAASKAGGDLGFLARGDLPPELREPVASMDPGDVRGPIQSERGLHILQLIEKKSGEVKSFDDAKEDLRRQLYEQSLERGIQNWTKELRRKAHVDIRR